MARKIIDVEQLNETLQDIPEKFSKWCMNHMRPMPIYYHRDGKIATCMCGKCGRGYVTRKKPVKMAQAVCERCNAKGYYQWMKATRPIYGVQTFYLLQKTKDEKPFQ